MADAWMPGARCIRAQTDGGQLGGGAPRVVWLTLGADPRTISVWSAAQRLNQENRSTHLVWDPLTGDIAQILPIVRAGCALGMPEYLDYAPDRLPAHPAGVNREGRLCVQIGVLGSPREPFTSFQMIGLAAILGWLDSWQIPRRWPASAGPVPPADQAPQPRPVGPWRPLRCLPGPRVRQPRPRRHRHRPPHPAGCRPCHHPPRAARARSDQRDTHPARPAHYPRDPWPAGRGRIIIPRAKGAPPASQRAAGAAWTKERRRSDEGRRRLEGGPEASGKTGRPGGERESRA